MEHGSFWKSKILGWVSLLLGICLTIKLLPSIVALLKALQEGHLSGRGALVSGLYHGLELLLALLSGLSGWAILTRRAWALLLNCSSAGAILMNSAYHAVHYGSSWVVSDREYWTSQRIGQAVSLFAPDLILTAWWTFCLWAILIRGPKNDPDPNRSVVRRGWVGAAISAACSYAANFAVHDWIPRALF